MGPIWGRQDPGGPHVGPLNFAIWDALQYVNYSLDYKKLDGPTNPLHASDPGYTGASLGLTGYEKNVHWINKGGPSSPAYQYQREITVLVLISFVSVRSEAL